MKFGVDVSEWDYDVDWSLVAQKVDFAVLRCGFGGDVLSQDDKYYQKNVAGCEKNKINYGVYLYSYATSEIQLDSEINHVKRLLQYCAVLPFCVFLDMEDKSTVELGKSVLTGYALKFGDELKKAGYRTGIYANQNWFNKYLDVAQIKMRDNMVWCAKYSSNPPEIPVSWDMWQYTSRGKIAGIGGDVDCNYWREVDSKKTIEQLADEVMAGLWGKGTARKQKLEAAGYDYYKVQHKVNELVNLEQVARGVIAGKWGNGQERKIRLEEAGYDYYKVQRKVNELLNKKS